LVTDNGANIIKAVRLLQDERQEKITVSSDSDSGSSSSDSEDELGSAKDLDCDLLQHEEEDYETTEAQLHQEVEEVLGKKRGKCFRYHTVFFK
jgi:hypothetical protein